MEKQFQSYALHALDREEMALQENILLNFLVLVREPEPELTRAQNKAGEAQDSRVQEQELAKR